LPDKGLRDQLKIEIKSSWMYTVSIAGNGYEFVGEGVCRGPKWSNEVWPKDEGHETFQVFFITSVKASSEDIEKFLYCDILLLFST